MAWSYPIRALGDSVVAEVGTAYSLVSSMPAISVDNLVKKYGEFTAVRKVSFDVEEGELVGILGANGAGKTTTVECIQGLRSVDQGSVRVFGIDPQTNPKSLRRLVGSQLQQSALPERIKVWEALDLFASLSPDSSDWSEVLDRWGLGDRRDSHFGSLSGGQQQRLFVALALINNPRLVFLDEMTTGLDPSSRRVAWDLIRQIRERGTTVVLVTHFMDEAEALCDRLLIFKEGRIAAQGSPEQLIEQHGGGIRVLFSAEDDLPWLGQVPHVETVTAIDGRHEVTGSGPVVAHVASALMAHGLAPADLRTERASLEEVFLSVTNTQASS